MNKLRRQGLWLLVGLLLASGIAGCHKKEETGPDVLVTINDEPIKTQDLQIAWNSLPVDQRKVYNSPKGIINLLEELVTYRLMALDAQNRRLDEDPLFKKRLEIYRQRLLVNALLDQAITDADLYSYFQKNFIHARFIRVSFPAGAAPALKAEAKAKADKAMAELADGTDFEEVVGDFSDAANVKDEGDMGYVTHQTVENMVGFLAAEALFGLKEPGSHTGVLEGKDGYYIFQMVEPVGNLDLRGLTPELSAQLRDVRREETIRSMANELRSRTDFKIVRNQQNMSDLLKTLEKEWPRIADSDTVGAAADEEQRKEQELEQSLGIAPETAPAPAAPAPAAPAPAVPAPEAAPATPPSTPAPGVTPAPSPAPAQP
jgi:hypothetical protein